MKLNLVDNLAAEKRYKIYLLPCAPCELNDLKENLAAHKIETLDLGRQLAEKIKQAAPARHLDIWVAESVRKLIEQGAHQTESVHHKIVALENFGILLEPAFHLGAEKLLAEISKNIHLLLIWSDQIEDNGLLHWTQRKQEFSFDLTAYEPKIITYNDEI